jgi:hypothetical protein
LAGGAGGALRLRADARVPHQNSAASTTARAIGAAKSQKLKCVGEAMANPYPDLRNTCIRFPTIIDQKHASPERHPVHTRYQSATEVSAEPGLVQPVDFRIRDARFVVATKPWAKGWHRDPTPDRAGRIARRFLVGQVHGVNFRG